MFVFFYGGKMSSLETVKVSNLLNGNYHFEIPEYQRGYRWRPEEVAMLISDITKHDDKDDEAYFLNVLILQKNTKSENSFDYDIVDGQQRLTTLSTLESICGTNNETIKGLLENNRSESDKYFIQMAKKVASEKIANKEDFKIKLDKSRFFVYEIEGTKEDAAKVFERINTGKIPLSSAELLKASWVSDEKDRIKQKIRASRWQRIEELLQNDDFYFFICPNREIKRYQATRMDYVLELFFSKTEEMTNYNEYFKTQYEKNPIFLYNELIKESSPNITIFEEIEKFVFDFLYAYCYLNITVRNYIGYLIYRKNHDDEFNVIRKLYRREDEFKNIPVLDEKDFQSLAQKLLSDNNKKIEDLTKDQDDRIIHPLLLLSLVFRYTKENLPFDFVRYASTNGWDIEHIHARNQREYDYRTVKVLFDEAKKYRFFVGRKEEESFIANKLALYNPEKKNEEGIKIFEKDILNEMSYYQNGLDYLANLINAIVNARTKESESSKNVIKTDKGYYNVLPPSSDEDWINKIGNLILLPASTNRGFGNWPYPLKCEYLKNVCETQGEYIPFCVEEKYDIQIQDQVEWTADRSKNYLKELKDLFALEEER